ncbi:hypothetical protein Tco_0761727, partial [Tanacetum coccineum]
NTHKEGASDADINILPKYIYAVSNDDVPMGTNDPDFQRFLLTEDAVSQLRSNTPFTSLQPSLPCCMHPEMAKGKCELNFEVASKDYVTSKRDWVKPEILKNVGKAIATLPKTFKPHRANIVLQ